MSRSSALLLLGVADGRRDGEEACFGQARFLLVWEAVCPVVLRLKSYAGSDTDTDTDTERTHTDTDTDTVANSGLESWRVPGRRSLRSLTNSSRAI